MNTNNINTVSKRLYNYEEAAEYLGLSRRHLQRIVKAGQISTCRFGRRVMFPVDGLEEFVALSSIPASASPSGPHPLAPR